MRELNIPAVSIAVVSNGQLEWAKAYGYADRDDKTLATPETLFQATAISSAVSAVAALKLAPAEKFRKLVRAHLETICGEGHDFIPVMLYDWRSLTPANRRRVIALKDRYDALWQKVTDELQAQGIMGGDAQLARLFTFGVLNWTARWYRVGGRKSLDEIAEEAARFLLRG